MNTDDMNGDDMNLLSNEFFQIIIDMEHPDAEENTEEINTEEINTEEINTEEINTEENIVDINQDYVSFISRLLDISGLNIGSNINSILNSSLTDPNQNIHKNVITDKGESQIELLTFDSKLFDEKTCPMTLLDFKNDDDIARLPCGHIFGQESILKWLKEENASCPVCREKIDSKEVKKNISSEPPPADPPPADLLHGGQNTMVNAIMSLMPIQSPPVMSIMHMPMAHNSSVDFINTLVDRRLRREEEQDIQLAILASLN
jgi:hypothetical protein